MTLSSVVSSTYCFSAFNKWLHTHGTCKWLLSFILVQKCRLDPEVISLIALIRVMDDLNGLTQYAKGGITGSEIWHKLKRSRCTIIYRQSRYHHHSNSGLQASWIIHVSAGVVEMILILNFIDVDTTSINWTPIKISGRIWFSSSTTNWQKPGTTPHSYQLSAPLHAVWALQLLCTAAPSHQLRPLVSLLQECWLEFHTKISKSTKPLSALHPLLPLLP